MSASASLLVFLVGSTGGAKSSGADVLGQRCQACKSIAAAFAVGLQSTNTIEFTGESKGWSVSAGCTLYPCGGGGGCGGCRRCGWSLRWKRSREHVRG